MQKKLTCKKRIQNMFYEFFELRPLFCVAAFHVIMTGLFFFK